MRWRPTAGQWAWARRRCSRSMAAMGDEEWTAGETRGMAGGTSMIRNGHPSGDGGAVRVCGAVRPRHTGAVRGDCVAQTRGRGETVCAGRLRDAGTWRCGDGWSPPGSDPEMACQQLRNQTMAGVRWCSTKTPDMRLLLAQWHWPWTLGPSSWLGAHRICWGWQDKEGCPGCSAEARGLPACWVTRQARLARQARATCRPARQARATCRGKQSNSGLPSWSRLPSWRPYSALPEQPRQARPSGAAYRCAHRCLAGSFCAGSFFAGSFFAGSFFAGSFFAGSFFAGSFFAGSWRCLPAYSPPYTPYIDQCPLIPLILTSAPLYPLQWPTGVLTAPLAVPDPGRRPPPLLEARLLPPSPILPPGSFLRVTRPRT
jgi:hypothetical protein